MIQTVDHSLLASTYLWLDHLICKNGQGYIAFTGQFQQSTGRINGYRVYASPFRQFVADSSVGTISSGFYEGRTFKTGVVDFNKGAILLPNAATGTVSGIFLAKEVNLYPVETSAEKLLFEDKNHIKPRHSPNFTGYNAYDKVYPAIFIEQQADSNTRLCFENCYSTTFQTRLTLLMDSNYLFQGVTRLLSDSKDRHIPIFNASEMPYNYLGNLKSGFNYESWRAAIQTDGSRLAKVKEVSITKFHNRINDAIAPNVVGGFVDLEFEILRSSLQP